jgi:hypothetical protein
LFVLRVAITIAAAGVSYVVLELPIRRVRNWHGRTFGTAALCSALVAALVLAVPDRKGSFAFIAPETVRLAEIPLGSAGASPAPIVAGGVDRAGRPAQLSRPARVLVIGDSTAFAMGQGLIEWAAKHRDQLRVTSRAIIGCGLSDSGEVPDHAAAEDCVEHRDSMPEFVDLVRPDVVLAMVTIRDVQDHVWDEAEGVLALTDERHRTRLLESYEALTASLLESGAEVVMWIVPPVPQPIPQAPEAWILDDDIYAVHHSVIQELAERFDEGVVTVDLDGWVAGADAPPERYDGIHWSIDAAYDVVDRYLAGEILGAALGPADAR